jgi:hypothetical protein
MISKITGKTIADLKKKANVSEAKTAKKSAKKDAAVASNTVAKASETSRIIKALHDRSTGENVDITITLHPGGYELIGDDVEKFLMLRSSMNSFINMMGEHDEVIEFTNYNDVVTRWWPIRRQYYEARIERQKIILRANIEILENKIRYCESGLSAQIKGLPVAEMERIVGENGYVAMNEARINNPGYVPNERLNDVFHARPKANFMYLLRLNDLTKSSEGLIKMRKELAALCAELETLIASVIGDIFPGRNLWNSELDKLAEVIKFGRRTEWQYGNFGKFHYE